MFSVIAMSSVLRVEVYCRGCTIESTIDQQ